MRLIQLLIYCLGMTGQPSNVGDTTIRGIHIRFSADAQTFPSFWHDAPINARYKTIDKAEIRRSKQVLVRTMAKYPARMLQNNLRTVYLFAEMNFYGLNYGGTNTNDTLYISNRGEREGYTDQYIEQTFHHEFSSILLRKFATVFDRKQWLQALEPGNDYNDPEEGNGAIRNNRSSQVIDTVLCRAGFLTEYASSSIENDVNTIAQNLFSPSKGFWDAVAHYPRIASKVRLLVAFYQSIDPSLTYSYFQKINP